LQVRASRDFLEVVFCSFRLARMPVFKGVKKKRKKGGKALQKAENKRIRKKMQIADNFFENGVLFVFS
jgi:hypothetical protein